MANGEGLVAAASKVSEAGPARIESTGSSGSRGTLRNFRKRQRQDLALSIALAGEDRTAAILHDGQLAANALEARDADDLVRLMGRLVGYLEAPQGRGGLRIPGSSLRSAAPNIIFANALSELSKHDGQCQLRDVILCLLGVVDERGLETSDIGTRKLLKIPFKHIASLVQMQSLDRTCWREQWIELRRVAMGSGCGLEPHAHLFGTVDVQRRRCLPHSERARTSGVYEPNSRVKQCATVIHDVANRRVLKCSKCAHTITSAWYFVHPKSGKLQVLMPNTGHQACRTPSTISRFRSADGSPHKADTLSTLDMCHHASQRYNCRFCNPAAFCSHGKMRCTCRVCRVGLKKRGRKPH